MAAVRVMEMPQVSVWDQGQTTLSRWLKALVVSSGLQSRRVDCTGIRVNSVAP